MSHLRVSERVPQTAFGHVASLFRDIIDIAFSFHQEPTPLVELDAADHVFVYLVNHNIGVILEDVALREDLLHLVSLLIPRLTHNFSHKIGVKIA